MINVGPGQRETIRGGRDQDLLTPFWQTATLCVSGAWMLAWLVAMALVVGPVMGYALSMAIFFIRWGRKIVRGWKKNFTYASYGGYLTWIAFNLLVHLGIAYSADLIWTDYVLDWSPWNTVLWTLLCCAMIAPPALLGYVIAIRILDPNYPSPRKAVNQRQPQMPWYPDEPVEQIAAGPQLLRVKVESTDPRYHSGILDLPPVREWYDFALWLLRHPDGFSEPNAKRFGVKINLRSNKPPWYGRGFRQVRDDLFDRGWAEWSDSTAHGQGITLYEEASAAFREYCENGPPPPQEDNGRSDFLDVQ